MGKFNHSYIVDKLLHDFGYGTGLEST